MLLNFEKIKMREDGTPERPVLILQTLAGQSLGSAATIGPILNAYNLEIEINYSSLSQINFDVARWSDGVEDPIYEKLTGFKIVYTDALGIYVLQRPEITGDGISEVKHLTGYSIEQLREGKLLFLEEGTYNFWNPVDRTGTILARILELFPGWTIGTVDPRFVGMYRTFDSYNEDVLQFCYNDAAEKFLCVFVFDVYKKKINVFSAEDSRGTLPIYLGYENLVSETKITELSDEIVTKLHMYGDDGLTITASNPMGTDYIVDLSYFVENGDLDIIAPDGSISLAEKYQQWKLAINGQRENFLALATENANLVAQELALQAEMASLNEQYETLKVEQGGYVQAISLEADGTTEKSNQETNLKNKTEEIDRKQTEIDAQQSRIDAVAETRRQNQNKMNQIAEGLSISSYFTDGEQSILEEFLQEQEMSDETFVATDIGTDTSGTSDIFSGSVSIAPGNGTCKIYKVNVTEPTQKTLYSITGGHITAGSNISGDVIRGTLEVSSQSVLSLYMGNVSYKGKSYVSGTMTIRGTVTGVTENTAATVEDGVELFIGSTIGFNISYPVSNYSTSQTYAFNDFCSRSGEYYRCIAQTTSGTWKERDWIKTNLYNLFLSTNVTEYQRYSVARELYDFAEETLHDLATPTYEFSLETSNFLFLNEFTPYRNALDMGKAVYVKLRKSGELEKQLGRADVIEANLIGLSFSYEDRARLSLTFSNRFKKRNGVKTLEGMIKNSYSSTRSFDTSRFVYGKTVDQAGQVEQAMKSALDVAKNKILGAHGQSVEISESGIHVSSTQERESDMGNDYQLRIIDSMIAMTDDGWQTAKLAIGRFNGTECHWDSSLEPGKTGDLWGVNAEVIFGKQLVGQSMIIESRGDNLDGENNIKQFKFDASGAWMNNATLTIQNNESRISIDPTYGIIGGTPDVFSAEGTSVTYNFLEDQSDPDSIKRDIYGIPSLGSTQSSGYYEHTEDVKFFLDLKTGNAYFNGTIYSKNGFIGGWTIDDGKLYAGDGIGYVRLNPGVEEYGEYAIWCGANNPVDAPFWVKKNGDMKAKNGMFTGQFVATGRGALAEDAINDNIETLPDINNVSSDSSTSAFYIFDTTPVQREGETWKNATYRDLVGFIAFDETGAGTTEEATDRVIIRTTNKVRRTNDGRVYQGVPIKIQSGSDMSLECANNGNIFAMSPIRMAAPLRMNTSAPICLGESFVRYSEPSFDSYEGAMCIMLPHTVAPPGGEAFTVSGNIFVYTSGEWRRVIDL